MRSNLLLACILTVACHVVTAQGTLKHSNVESWEPEWRFARGDNPAWSDPDFDDGVWEALGRPLLDPGVVDTASWRGIGWFRTTFVTDSSLAGVPPGYQISLVGAAEMYLDGILFASFGRPSLSAANERALRLGPSNPAIGLLPALAAGRHTLAVRTSNVTLSAEGETQFGFNLSFGEPTALAEQIADQSRALAAKRFFLTGIASVLALIFLLLFAFQPKQTNNLLLGGLSALVGFVVFADLHSRIVTDPSRYLDWRRYMELAAIAGWITAVRMVRVSFFKEFWRLFYPLLALGGLVALHVYFDPIGGFWSLTIFSVVATSELLRRVGLAVFLSRPGSTTVAVGAALFLIGAVHDYLSGLGWIDPVLGFTDLVHFGMVGFLVCFALFLGTEFARANRSLEHRVSQIAQEAEKAIQDEKVNQGFRIDRIQAEFDKRRKELEQAKLREVDDIRRSLTVANERLKEMQDRLVHVEGSASLGKLATGIASSTGDLLKSILSLTASSTDLVEELRGSLAEGPKKGQVDDVLRQLRKNLDRINEQSDTAREVMDGIMQHASPASAEFERVDINKLIDQYVNLTLHGAKGEFPALELVVERLYDHRAGTIEAPPSRLGRALMCILRNAVESVAAHAEKAGEDFQPTITVSTQRLDHAVLIRVRDNGPGIPQDLRDRVFEPFFSTSRQKSGLGLSIAQQTIVDELGGTFGLEHFKEQGAGFYITIPFAREVITEEAGETSE